MLYKCSHTYLSNYKCYINVVISIYLIINPLLMRYESRAGRSLSFIQRENKENVNVQNVLVNKSLRVKEQAVVPKVVMAEETGGLKQIYSQLIAKDYIEEIRSHLCCAVADSGEILAAHTVTPDLRAKMVDWVIEVLSSYRMSEETFFRTICLMDSYLKKARPQEKKDLHLIGVTAMFTASKHEEIRPFKLHVVYEKIARKKFRKHQILDKQSEIVCLLDFRIDQSTVYDIVRLTPLNLDLTPALDRYFKQILLYLSKMVLYSLELAQEPPKNLAAAVLFIGLKTLEQAQHRVQPEKKIFLIVETLGVTEPTLIQVSRKVLDLAKGFSKIYPDLTNLKKFNKFQYYPHAQM